MNDRKSVTGTPRLPETHEHFQGTGASASELHQGWTDAARPADAGVGRDGFGETRDGGFLRRPRYPHERL